MFLLALRTLRHRAGGFAAGFASLFLGAAIIMACGGLLETGVRLAVPPHHLTEADVVVAGNQRHALPELNYAALLPERVRVDTTLINTVAALPGVAEAEGYVFDDPAPAGTVDAISVIAEPGTDVAQLKGLLDAELPDSVVTYTGDDRGLAERPEAMLGTDILASLAGVFGAMAIMVSIYAVASMLALSVQQRNRELALLRAVGSTPAQLRKLILGETIILAAVATVLAIIPGRWLGRGILDLLMNGQVVVDGIAFRQGWIPTVTAIGATMLAAVVGALAAGRRAAAIRPTQALAEAGLPERRPMGIWRALLGLLLLAGGTALALVTWKVLPAEYASATGGPAMIVWALGLAALSPLLTRPLAALLGWPLGALTGKSGRMAIRNVRANIDRTAAVVAPVIVLTGVATGMLYLQSTEVAAGRQAYADSLKPDVIVTAEHGVADNLVDRITALPGVGGAIAYVPSTGFVEQPHDSGEAGEGWTLQGVTLDGVDKVVPFTITDGSLDRLDGDTVALDTRRAQEIGVGLGDRLTVRMGDNTSLEVEVVALFTAEKNLRTLVLPADVVAAHTTLGRPAMILVAADGTTEVEQVVTRIEELTVGEDGVTVADHDALFASFDQAQGTQAFANYAIVVMIVGYTAVSVINALASSTTTRRRELGLQRLIGFTRGQVLRMLGTESLLVVVVGTLLGTVSAIVTLVPFSLGRAGTPQPSGSPLVYCGVVVGAVLLALLASLVPGWWVTRRRPVEAVAE